MSKKIKGLFMSLLLLASVLVPSLGSLGTVKADEVKDTVDITVHKRLFDSDVANNIQNTGSEMEFEGEALPNIQFTLYDVTDKYTEELKKDGVDAQEATENLVAYYSDKNNKPTGNGVAQGTTDNEGNVTLSNIAKKDADGNFKTYLLLETKKPSAIKTESAPIILTMPMYRHDNGQPTTEELSNIHIYPKNVEDKDNEGENVGGKLTKELVTKIPHNTTWNSSLNAVNGNLVLSPRVGRLLEYKVTYNVPATTTFEEGKGIKIVDDPGEGLVLPSKVVKDAKGNVDDLANFNDTIVDTLNSNDVVDNVTVTSNVQGLEKIDGDVTYEGEKETGNSLFTLTLKGDAYKNLAGETITITYYAYLAMRNTTLDNPIDNKVTAKADTTVGPQTSTDGNARLVENGAIATLNANKPVAVGAVNFKKVDAQSGKALAGAEFVIYCEHAKGYVKFDEVESEIAGKRTALKFVSDPNNAKVFKSGEDGTFKAEYLPYSTEYKLVETKAPEGYVKGEDVQFTVAQGTKDETKVVEVKNVKKGILPSTGGMGIYLFLALGVALMGGAYVWFKKARKNENV
ncbi:SpaH/EbpB family LPXTG-anchored major pilin [Ligilactobacillus faecis]|uniref:SpaH/EbpB family LPXTG-anchored major pilin n=1 Tax=Ligilactobacillus faecis TaxID=762833 RepID=A0ABV4DNR4_9LACO